MLRISATLLESFRLYSKNDWYQESDLIDSIKGQLKQTPKMKLGQAFHYLLEHPQLSLAGFYEHRDHRFHPSCIQDVLARVDARGVFESKIEKVIGNTREGDDLVLVTKADHIYGLHLSEFKAPLKATFDAEKYMESYQWRVMAWLYEAQKITYHVACLELGQDCFELRTLDSIDVYPYAGLEQDVRALLRELIRYLRLKKLDSFLRRDDVKAVSA